MFWHQSLRCSIPNVKNPIVFYKPKKGYTLDECYRDLFSEQPNSNLHVKSKNLLFSADAKVTLLSNLIEIRNSLELEYIQCVPPVTFNKLLLSQGVFKESALISDYIKDLPNRPYTFE